MGTVLVVALALYGAWRAVKSGKGLARKASRKLRLRGLLWGFLLGVGLALVLLHESP